MNEKQYLYVQDIIMDYICIEENREINTREVRNESDNVTETGRRCPVEIINGQEEPAWMSSLWWRKDANVDIIMTVELYILRTKM